MDDRKKATIKHSDMSESMQQDAVDIASIGMSKYSLEKVRMEKSVLVLLGTLLSSHVQLLFLC